MKLKLNQYLYITGLAAVTACSTGVDRTQSQEPVAPPTTSSYQTGTAFQPISGEAQTQQVATKDTKVVTSKSSAPKPSMVQVARGPDFYNKAPTNIRAGECYGKVVMPAKYKTVQEKVLQSEGEASVVVTPAQYKTVTQRVMVTPEKIEMKPVAAKYAMKTVTVVDRPEHTVLKKDTSMGSDVMCKVKVPATYKTVKQRVMVSGPSVQKVVHQAKYKTVEVQKLVAAAKVQNQKTNPKYTYVARQVVTNPSQIVWKKVLCKTNMTAGLVRDIQSSLRTAGYNPGTNDGVLGESTATALKSFQQAKGLPQGALTYETLSELGINQAAH